MSPPVAALASRRASITSTLAGRAGLDRLALRVAAALEGAELVDVLARRDVAQGVGRADHPRSVFD